MKLHEILDSSYEFQFANGNHGDKIASFKDDSGETVIVNFEWWGGPELYIIDFKRKGRFTLTNDSPAEKNQAVKIMSTVVEIIKKFLQEDLGKTKPLFLSYSIAKDEKSRGTLYTRMLNRVAEQAGYVKVEDADTIDHPVLPGWWRNKTKMSGGGHDFVLLANKDSVSFKVAK